MCTIIAACTGIIGASEVMVGVMAIPAMLKRKLQSLPHLRHDLRRGSPGDPDPAERGNRRLWSGSGDIGWAASHLHHFPGILLSIIYIIYIAIRSNLNPVFAPPVPPEETRIPLKEKLVITATGMLPPWR